MSDGREGKRPRLFRMPTSRGRLRGDIDRELHFHIEGRIEELIASGLTREQAEREVAQRFGDMAAVRDQLEEIDTRTHRRHELGEWRGALARDFGQALRGILLRPAFAAVVVLTLGLGIGATTAIYALLDAVVLRPLPYPNAARLVYIEHPVPGVETNAKWRMSQAGYFFFRKNSKALEDIALYNKSEASLVTSDEAERVRAAAVSGNFFEVVGARPLLGRSFTDADNLPNAPQVAMLGYSFWRQRFNGDPRVVGTRVSLGSVPVTIVGVALPGRDRPAPTGRHGRRGAG
jgi:putative ABC transport system permease protein